MLQMTTSMFRFCLCSVSLCLLMIMLACQDAVHQTDLTLATPDTRIDIDLVSQHPDIMTPIGISIDDQDALYVLESHTHQAPSAYQGPAYDRIKKGVDKDGDGIPDAWIVFADSLEDGMNLVYAGNHTFILVEKDKVWSITDEDADGKSDQRDLLLEMNPPESVYDHAGLLGAAISADGWIYVSRGNTGAQAWTLTGSDGKQLHGYGDGGNVVRCRLDGSQLEEVATGFWNPFDLRWSQNGRLLLTDNDPDSRGPNRLIDIVPGGDYGYQSLYGGSGIHSFLAWNGELPGTLPYAAALGEAPCGLLDASFSNLPEDYHGHILVAIWEENRIVHVPLHSTGQSYQGEAKVLLQGDSTFHPVSMATNSQGDIYLTDWVMRQYPNHRHGRIWRFRSQNKPTLQPKPNNPLYSLAYDLAKTQEELVEALASSDPFLATAARKSLEHSRHRGLVEKLLTGEDATLRLQSLLIYTATHRTIPSVVLSSLLHDPMEDIRRMAMVYTATHARVEQLPVLEASLQQGQIGQTLVETYLATIRHLNPDFIEGYQTQAERYSKNLKRELPEGYLLKLIQNKHIAAETRAVALPYLEAPQKNLDILLPLLKTEKPILQEALLMALRTINDETLASNILALALEESNDLHLRMQALTMLEYQSLDLCEELKSLEQEDTFQELLYTYHSRCGKQDHPSEKRPSSDEEWQAIVDGSGDPIQGKWVFQSRQAQCMNCHQVAGWGGQFGPDLSHIGSSKSRALLINSILTPSAQLSPEWQGWYVIDQTGKTHYGRQIDVSGNGRNVELMLPSGEFETFQDAQSFGLAPASLMPEGLEQILSPQQFNDLIAYLESLQ